MKKLVMGFLASLAGLLVISGLLALLLPVMDAVNNGIENVWRALFCLPLFFASSRLYAYLDKKCDE